MRGQTDRPVAPPGFELNNPWRVGVVVERMVTTSTDDSSARNASCKRRGWIGTKNTGSLQYIHMNQHFP
ncbi:hypothetical protein DE146DRAFT_789305, partial [Phaeosphaeria sp. MPI-PUGE-AT-0046c]